VVTAKLFKFKMVHLNLLKDSSILDTSFSSLFFVYFHDLFCGSTYNVAA
jgi:hypothetical protein